MHIGPQRHGGGVEGKRATVHRQDQVGAVFDGLGDERPKAVDDLTVARPDSDESLPHFGVVGDTYTVLVAGADTAGRYTLIDMHVPSGGGPPPHRHDFEEMFTVVDGEVELNFRGESLVAKAGETVNIPANAPHAFRNAGGEPARLLCLCAPAGQDEFFAQVGIPVATRTEIPPQLDADAQTAFIAKSMALAPEYRTDLG
jgi:quercetin dioxygenase-like cupin family protein